MKTRKPMIYIIWRLHKVIFTGTFKECKNYFLSLQQLSDYHWYIENSRSSKRLIQFGVFTEFCSISKITKYINY